MNNQPNNAPISSADEVKAVALLARGDSNAAVARQTGISESSIANIKERNADTLAVIRAELVARETKQAKKLLDRSHKLIESRLDNETTTFDNREKLQEKYDAGEITNSQYLQGLRALPMLTLTELTALSKEMFNQSQVEEGKPTSISAGTGNTPQDAKSRLEQLLQLMRDNDEVTLLELKNDD